MVIVDVVKEKDRIDLVEIFKFQCQYFDKESYEEFYQRIVNKDAVYLAGYIDQQLVGICYGEIRRPEVEYCLQGIGIDHGNDGKYLRKGLGSTLLQQFEEKVKHKGYRIISLGSADDPKVEAFYYKNKYEPIEIVAKDKDGNEIERVKINKGADCEKEREKMRQRNNPQEAIFIFEKKL